MPDFQIQAERYLTFFKMFKLKGDPYIIIIKNMMFGIAENMESISYIQLPDTDCLIGLPYIACRFKDLCSSNAIISNIHIYNMMMPMITTYTFDWPDFEKLDDDIAEKIYSMKSSDNMSINKYHLDSDINKEYLLSVSYGLFSISKGDEVDNYIRRDNGSIILKSVIHKKKQKTDIIVYHKFLPI